MIDESVREAVRREAEDGEVGDDGEEESGREEEDEEEESDWDGAAGLVVALLHCDPSTGTRFCFCSCFTLRKNPTGQSSKRNQSNSFSESSRRCELRWHRAMACDSPSATSFSCCVLGNGAAVLDVGLVGSCVD